MSGSIDVNEGQGGLGFRPKALWAFMAVHGDGDEGLIGELDRRTNTWVPFVAADKQRLEELTRRARDIGRERGVTIRLVRFDQRTDLEIFHPDGRRERPREQG